MELEEFVKYFAELFDDTDSSEIKADTAFHELDEWGRLLQWVSLLSQRQSTGRLSPAKK